MEVLLVLGFLWFIVGCLGQQKDSKPKAWDDPEW